MTRIIRVLAVIALALSPVWGVQTVIAASSPAPSHYPTFPSYESNGCATAINGYITCGGNGIILTQVNSGYECSTILVSFDGVVLQQQPLVVTVTADDGRFNSNFSVSLDGDYYVNIPGFLVNNLAVIQITASTGGSFFLSDVGVAPCAVPTSTGTANPSDTASDTPVPVTGTPTAIPSFTRVPVTHNTFTPTVTRTGTPVPNTPTITATPGPTERDCGDVSFPLLNCDFSPGTFQVNPDHWTNGANGTPFVNVCWNGGNSSLFSNQGGFVNNCSQTVNAGASGFVFVRYQLTYTQNVDGQEFFISGTASLPLDPNNCPYGTSSFCTIGINKAISSGTAYTFQIVTGNAGHQAQEDIYLDKVWVQAGSPFTTITPVTPVPATSTSTPTAVPGTATETTTVTETPVSIPGAPETAIPTSTECPGGCVVTALTAVPGMATRTTVDTSPFSALTHLSMARSSCAPFGYVQIPYPVITGTPALGQPLNFGWTVPVTHTWDNTNPLSNTAIQPCAMSEIPSSLWDFTYWFSVFGIATVFIMWLIGLVGRLSGEETING